MCGIRLSRQPQECACLNHPTLTARWQAVAHQQQQQQQLDWDDVRMWLRGLPGSALLCFENAEHALRDGETLVGCPVEAAADRFTLILQWNLSVRTSA